MSEAISAFEASNLVSDYDSDNIVFWIGAGADRLEPACLPTASELVDGLFEILFLREQADSIRRTWDSCSLFLNETRVPPRMETILEALKRPESLLNQSVLRYNLSAGLEFFDHAPSNRNTQLLGYMVSKGSTVVTTNYSTVMEKEVELITGSALSTAVISPSKSFCVSKRGEADAWDGAIVHLHGMSSIHSSTGVTLSQISRRFPEQFLNYLGSVMEDEKRLFVFFGYSGSDEYDVNPLFQKMAAKAIADSSTALYVRYGDGSAPKNVREREEALLRPFAKSYVCTARQLSDIVLPGEDFKYREAAHSGFDWRKEFIQLAEIPDDSSKKALLSDILSLGVSEYFGFGIRLSERLDSKRVSELRMCFRDDEKDYLRLYISRHAESLGASSEVLALGEVDSFSLETLLTVGSKVDEKSWGVAPNAILEKVRGIRAEKEAGWNEVTTPANHWIGAFMEEALAMPSKDDLRRLCEDRASDLKAIRESSGLMLSLPYWVLVDLRQYAVECRIHARALVFAEIGTSDFISDDSWAKAISSIDNAIDTYSDISSIRGVARSLCDKALIFHLWGKFACGESHGFRMDMLRCYRRAYALAIISGHERSMAQCERVGRYMSDA